ncbi:ankyrin repeat domain-containing protein [Spirochaeta cellobiosiphila]|uniref:ankyrin repeat domain-containing protein n=1 Tax=Spirochaeta cellobiosiphila TaxID=504483 RepID=UPI0004251956|nr:ankyrin repeat domain-containing protein [Spirochaeta cellobiosiphila]
MQKASMGILCLLWFSLVPAMAQTTLTADITQKISQSVYEVVIADAPDDPLEYEKELPWDQVPYQVRNDPYQSIGTAFAVGPNLFLSAAHVFTLEQHTQQGEFSLRDSDGTTYPVDQVLKYDNNKDFILFTTKNMNNEVYLDISDDLELNQGVYAVGNAYGEGVIIRNGLLTSLTPEAEKGAWKWLRFSAPASPGNSGGPLLNSEGKVIGIVRAKNENENLNYGLSISDVGELKAGKGTLHLNWRYVLPNINHKYHNIFEYDFDLPQSYQNLQKELPVYYDSSLKESLDALLEEYKKELFPNDSGSKDMLRKTYASMFPCLIHEKDDSTWGLAAPSDIETFELSQGGYMKAGSLAKDTYWQIELPRNDHSWEYFDDPERLIDLYLEGDKITRNIGSSEIRITSFGKPSKTEWITDQWDRRWLMVINDLPFADYQSIITALPTPSGMIGLTILVPTNASYSIQLDIKTMINYIYLSFNATYDQWKYYLDHKENLSDLFVQTRFEYDAKGEFLFESDEVAMSYDEDLVPISDDSKLFAVTGFYPIGSKVRWDYSRLFFYENETSANYFGLEKVYPPIGALDKDQIELWQKLTEEQYPYNKDPYLSKGNTFIHGTRPVVEEQDEPSAVWEYYLSQQGNKNKKYMATQLTKLELGFKLKDRELPLELNSKGLALIEGLTIFDSIRSGNKQVFDEFINRRVDMEARDDDFSTPLVLAIKEEQWEMAQVLLDYNVSLDEVDKEGRSALFYSLYKGQNTMATQMIDRGAPVNLSPGVSYSLLMAAIDHSSEAIVLDLLEKGSSVNGLTTGGWTVLHAALRQDKEKVSLKLIPLMDDINAPDSKGWTPLLLAARYGSMDINKALVEAGADPHTQIKQSGAGALTLSLLNGDYPDVPNYYISLGLDVDQEQPNGWTPLMTSIRYGNEEQIKQILESATTVDNGSDPQWTPVMLAIRYGTPELVLDMIEKGYSSKTPSSADSSALILASRYSSLEVVRKLVSQEASLEDTSPDGYTPLMMALRYGKKDIASYLIDAGSSVNVDNEQGWSPLRLALRYDEEETIQKLIRRGAKIDQGQNKEGWTDLHLAVRYDSARVARLLMSQDVRINYRNAQGYTALHLAVSYNPNIVMYLIDKGAGVNLLDNQGNTPLHRAVIAGNTKVVQLLLEYGADKNISNKEGLLPGDLVPDSNEALQSLFKG